MVSSMVKHGEQGGQEGHLIKSNRKRGKEEKRVNRFKPKLEGRDSDRDRDSDSDSDSSVLQLQ